MSEWDAAVAAMNADLMALFGEPMTHVAGALHTPCRGLVRTNSVDLIDGQIQFGQAHDTILTDLEFAARAGDEMRTAAGGRYRVERDALDGSSGLWSLAVRRLESAP